MANSFTIGMLQMRRLLPCASDKLMILNLEFSLEELLRNELIEFQYVAAIEDNSYSFDD
jgi:hypothetical protein